MPFSSLSDDYGDQCWTLSDKAFRLHTEAIVWSNRKLLDCVIPKDDLRRFAKHPEAASELIAGGWWEQTASAYVIVHQAPYQRTREAVIHRQRVNRENALRGGRPPKAPREQFSPDRITDSVSDSVSDSQSDVERKGKERNEHQPNVNREQIDRVTGEVTRHVTPDVGGARCSHPLTLPIERQRGICNPCYFAHLRRAEAAS